MKRWVSRREKRKEARWHAHAMGVLYRPMSKREARKWRPHGHPAPQQVYGLDPTVVTMTWVNRIVRYEA